MTPEFEHVSLLLQEPLSDEVELLIKDLENIEVWNSRMHFLLAQANSRLERYRFEVMPEKGNKSEFERKIQLESDVAEVIKERDMIEALCEAIKTRITLGQSILRYYSSTQNIQYKDNTQKQPW